MADLSLFPSWDSLPLQLQCAPFPDDLSDLTVVDALGLVIVGGPSSIAVYQVFERQRLLFALPARSVIAGYAVGQGTLFVQDGPMLACWSLDQTVVVDGRIAPVCLSAINLVTGATATGGQAAGVTAAQLDQLIGMDPVNGALWAAVTQARRRLDWIRLLAALEAMRASWTDGQPRGPGVVWPAALDLVTRFIREELFETDPRVAHGDIDDLLTAAQAALAAARDAAAALVFGAPVVRQHQVASPVLASVFVLATDGGVHSLDDALSRVAAVRFEPAGEPRLAMAELPIPENPNQLSCHLYYVTATGGIRELDAGTNPIAAAGLWPATSAPANLLPLDAVDGVLWGGGVTGADFFGLPTQAPGAAIVSALAVAGSPWRRYVVDSVNQMAIVSSDTQVRLLAYGAGAKVRDRWRLAPAPGWAAFVPRTAPSGVAASPTLVWSLDRQAAAPATNVGFRVFVANTVDAASLDHASDYPPPPSALGTGTLAPGSLPGALSAIAWVRALPAIMRGSAYAVVQPTSTFDAVIAWMTADFSGVEPQAPFDKFVSAAKDAAGHPPFDPGTVALPSFGTDYLIAASLDAFSAVLPAAEAELAHLARMIEGVKIATTISFNYFNGHVQSGIVQPAKFVLVLSSGERVPVTSDSAGAIVLDARHDGQTAIVAEGASGDYMWFLGPSGDTYQVNWVGWRSNSVALSVDQPASLTITFRLSNPSDAAAAQVAVSPIGR